MNEAQSDVAQAYRDYAMQVTTSVGAHLVAGAQPPSHLTTATSFPPHFSPDEQIWGGGPFLLWDFRALGDGSYLHQSGVHFGFGGLGLLFAGASMAAQASGNNQRRSAARRDAQPRWVVIDEGDLFVSTHGLYLATRGGLHPWSWEEISRAELAGPGVLAFSGQSVYGPVSWQVQSEFAELAFLCWALVRHPRHYQLLSRTWIRPGWNAAIDGRREPLSPALPKALKKPMNSCSAHIRVVISGEYAARNIGARTSRRCRVAPGTGSTPPK